MWCVCACVARAFVCGARMCACVVRARVRARTRRARTRMCACVVRARVRASIRVYAHIPGSSSESKSRTAGFLSTKVK